MKNLYFLITLLLFSCGYPDIDSVPDFKNIKLTDEELLDLCNIKTSDKFNEKLCKN